MNYPILLTPVYDPEFHHGHMARFQHELLTNTNYLWDMDWRKPATEMFIDRGVLTIYVRSYDRGEA